MEKTITFTSTEIGFLYSLLAYAKRELEQDKAESHSGVDQLLYNDWIHYSEDLISKVFRAMPDKQIETSSEDLPVEA